MKGINMGNKRKQARRAARQVLKNKSRINGYEIDTIIVDELASAPALSPKPKRDNSPIEALNEAQAHYLISLDNKALTFATGEAGCGKTYLATAVAAQRLLDKEVDKIIVTRPVLQAEEDLGFLPGDISEKFAPFFRPVYDVLQKRLGSSFLEYCLKPDVAKVEIAPFAYMRGRTFENAVVILDEAQNVTASQMKMFLTRMGENVTVIVNGDITQCDLPGNVKSGLEDALERFQPSSQVGLIEFMAEDCVRSELCKIALEAYL
ncbi:phosphate starvation-inducible protein PhoH [Salmonella enterica subsp. enterica serovar Saintpaul]|nr:phosphate starvation-inducible protein PhoH [Salmonella enterica]NMI67341.1 phosphate starvation-inducible protein PhoH [Salmonella enterica subsp. enterica serovar Bovismorbificans]NMJ39328.1 phosphate starvation-inducible protein PhoH [Salmonella enterica subsp. enterica serovar Saintpaul]NMJ50881.1 phosphate starvation-inducible protein PhoH [Salmonella enterica subsp. enterica serovar Anatum]EHI9745348.1 phosphate starvation-inducible protein PhoH [Salmonella enterica]